MAMLDVLTGRIKEKGWLAISNLYFDNSYIINIFATRGYVAYSPSNEVFLAYSCLDSTDSSVVEGKFITMDKNHCGMQQNITVAGQEHLQHFDFATYSHYNWYNDDQESTPWPNIPAEAEIRAFTKNPETGLYDGTDTATMINYRERSCVAMYGKEHPYSGANVEAWQAFYKNHDKFVKMLNECYGISDAY